MAEASTSPNRAAGDEAVARLREIIGFDTTNPPGNELPLVRRLADELRAEGLEPQVLESAQERGNLAVRLAGDGSQRPLLLLSHLDVVPVEPSQWTHAPFAGELADGMVWGRGAIDCKLATTVQMQIVLLCKRLSLPLKRDLVLVAAGDEELGGKTGVGWMVENHPGIFDAEYVVNEGGGFALLIDGRPVYTCQVGEKGGADLDFATCGRPGHASVPHGENAIVRLGPVLEALGRKLPHRVVPSARAFFEAAAAGARPQVRDLLLATLDPEQCDQALAQLPVNEPTRLMFDAMLRNTCAPTVLEAGVKRNVIPSSAQVSMSGRPLPGEDEESFRRDVEATLGAQLGQGVDYRMGTFRPGLEFDHQTPLFGALAQALTQQESDAVLVPYMQTGGTDGRFLRDMDTTVYGFVPMRYEPGLDFFDLCHGHDERVSVDNVHFALDVMFDAVKNLNGIDY